MFVFTTSVRLPNGAGITVEGIISEKEMESLVCPEAAVRLTLMAQAARLADNMRMVGVFPSCSDCR